MMKAKCLLALCGWLAACATYANAAPPPANAGAPALSAAESRRLEAAGKAGTTAASHRMEEAVKKVMGRLDDAAREAFRQEQRDWDREKEAAVLKKAKEAPTASSKAVYWSGEAKALEARAAELEQRLATLPPLGTPLGAPPALPPAELANRALDTTDFTGIYVGEATSRQSLITVEWQLTREGDATVNALATSYLPGGSAAQALGSARYHGKYDAAKHVLRLTTTDGSKGASPFSFEGLEVTFEPATGALKGTFANGAGTVTATRDAARSKVLQGEAAAEARQLAGAPTSFWQARDQSERSLILLRWLNRMVAEYPEIDSGHLVGVDEKAINLFMDDSFTPVFDKPLEQFSRADVDRCFRLAMECVNHPSYGKRFGSWRSAQLITVFSPARMKIQKVITSVAFRRTRVTAMKAVLAELAALPSTRAGFERAEGLRKRINDVPAEEVDLLWPSQRKTVDETAMAARRRTADGALAEAADEILRGARGYENAVACRDFEKAYPEMVSLATPAAREKETGRVQARLRESLAGLMQDSRKELTALGSGAPAVSAGMRWYRNFDQQFQSKFKDGSIEETRAAFLHRRPADLAAGEQELLKRLELAETETQIAELLLEHLGAPGDEGNQVASRIRAAAAERTAAVRWELEKATYSERELALMAKPGVVTVPPNYPEPSEHEIALAVLRAFAKPGKMLNADTAEYAPPSPMNLLRTKPLTYKIQVRKVQIGEVRRNEDGSYHCVCRLFLGMEIPSFASSDSLAQKLVAQLAAQIEKADPEWTPLTMRLTSTGWRSPEYEQATAQVSFQSLLGK